MFSVKTSKKMAFNFDALDFIPSKTLKEYLTSKEYAEEKLKNVNLYLWDTFPNWSYMQLATVCCEYAPTRKAVKFLRQLANYDDNIDEKALFRMAAKDLAKNKYRGFISNKTSAFYDFHFKNRPDYYPFGELLHLPIILKKGDVVFFKVKNRNRRIYGIVCSVPDYKSNKLYGIPDESVTILLLRGKNEILDEEKQIYYDFRIAPAKLNKVPNTQIPKQYKQTVALFRERFC